jgi:hypothetical protein
MSSPLWTGNSFSRWEEKNKRRSGRSSTAFSLTRFMVGRCSLTCIPFSAQSASKFRRPLTSLIDISETEYRISIELEVAEDDAEDAEPPTVLLQVKYPEEYPDQAPILELLAPPNAPTHPLFNVASDKDGLLDSLTETIEDNMGMAMIFTLVSTLKDNAEQLIASRQQEAENEREQKMLAAEREENKKFHGTPVTPETFTAWRAGFRKEMEEARQREEEAEEAAEKKKNRGKEAVVQLTGKQLWERGLAGKIEEDDEDYDDVPVQEVEKLKVEA